MRVVLDSNVLLAGLGTRGLCEAVLAACLTAHEVVLSELILTEVARHLEGKFKLPASAVRARVAFLRKSCDIVKPADVEPDACRDPDDLMVLGTAEAGRAECIVTGDDDLLALKVFGGVAILSPRAFHERLRKA